MIDKRYKQRKPGMIVQIAIVGCVSLVLAGCIGFGFASAGGNTPKVDAFGIDEITSSSPDQTSSTSDVQGATTREPNTLTNVAQRDISKGIEAIKAEEEAERKAAEEAARAEEAAHQAAAEAARARQQSAAGSLAGLSDVDWSVGKDAFISEWTQRINSYLYGSALSGQGATFANAAWEYGVDPRWSPAISNTESSKGAHCFLSHNAWGWGKSSWSNWEDAIYSHVAGLASKYGYSLTYGCAQVYCPPNYNHWFSATLNQMKMI